jgi:prephenate dehydratase
MKIGYLGPEGTFSHEAILAFQAKSNKKEIKEAALICGCEIFFVL